MKVSAALLAGGESHRMGRDKATLIFRGKPLWQIQLDLLRSLRPLQILLSARTDPVWRPADIEFVKDAQPSRGPLSGLTTALARSSATHLLVLAVDMPLMDPQYLRSLCHDFSPGIGLVPIIGDRLEPLAAIYPAELHPKFAAALSGSDYSLQTLTRKLADAGKLRLVPVAKDHERYFRNLNEPGDLENFARTDLRRS
jgi:molybdopterin-guanine dinucleotide biosynthesis protein A